MLTAALVVFAASTQVLSASPQGAPPPNPRRIQVRDGDTLIVPRGARVRLVHRREGIVRAIFNPGQRWLVLLVDYVEPDTGKPDGIVDASYRYGELSGNWPFGERWDGSAILDDYSMTQGPPGLGIGITVNGAFIQILRRADDAWFEDTGATTILSAGEGGSAGVLGGPGQRTFDAVEQRAVVEAAAHAQGADTSTRTTIGPGGTTLTSRVGMSASPGSAGGVRLGPAPVRVGSTLRQPTKIADAKPVMPADAQQAGIRGVVIVEIVIGADGTVTSAKVLRSILPSIDQAAIDAVKQWRYEPTQLNGQPVPVIMTVTVPFP